MNSPRAVVMAVVIICASSCTSAPSTTATTREEAAPTIVIDRASADIFPASWHVPAIDAKAQVLPVEERRRAQDLVERSLAKYPPAFLTANLRTVYVLGHLEYDGVATGGTNSRRDVYLVARRMLPAADIEKNLHAEFSSILLRRYPAALDHEAWQRTLPPLFVYRGSGVLAVQRGEASTRSTESLYPDGFLSEYAKASVEEDFNGYAGRLWFGDPELWRALVRYPKVAVKTRLVIAFYTALDATMTEDFFRALAPASSAD